MLAFPRGAIEHGNVFLLRPTAQATAKRARHAHQMAVVERVVAALQTRPPDAKSSGAARQRKISIQNDPVHTIVLAGQQVRVSQAQGIRSNHGESPKSIGDSLLTTTAPQGPLFLGAVPEKA